VPLLAGSISFQDAHSGSGLIPLFRRRLFEILEFISTLISACRPMSSGLSQAALRSCASCAAFGNWFRRLSISHWSLPLSYHITDVLAVFTGYENGWLGRPFYLKFWSAGPRWSEIADFEPIFARYASAITPIEKSSINTNRKSTTRFPISLR